MSKAIWSPLSSGFMAVSIIGFFLSIWLIDWNTDPGLAWGFTLTLFFALMFIASIISMTKAEPIPEHMEELAIHEHFKKKHQESTIKGLLHKLDEKPKKNHFMWQDAVMIVYAIFYVYYIVMAIMQPGFIATSALAIPFFLVGLFIAVWMLIDIVSSQKYAIFEKTVFALIVIILGGLGIFIYYIARRIRNDFGS